MTKQEHLKNFIAAIKRGEVVPEPIRSENTSEISFHPKTGWRVFRWYCTSETCNHNSHQQSGTESIARESALAILGGWAQQLADEDARIAADAAHLASL